MNSSSSHFRFFQKPEESEDKPSTVDSYSAPLLKEHEVKPFFKTPVLRERTDQYVKDSRFRYHPLIEEFFTDPLDEGDVQRQQIQLEVKKRIAEIQEEVISEARERGYREGYQKGEKEAQERQEEVLQEKKKNLEAFIHELDQIRPQLLQKNKEILADAILEILSHILVREIGGDSNYLLRKVMDALDQVETREELKILVHPHQLERMKELFQKSETMLSSYKNISFETSQKLAESDVILETDWNRIDATLKSQLESFREILSSME